jgi:hypothetical protein
MLLQKAVLEAVPEPVEGRDLKPNLFDKFNWF